MKNLTKDNERALSLHILDDSYHYVRIDEAVNSLTPFKVYIETRVDPFFKYSKEQLNFLRAVTWEYIIDESERLMV